jgi:hypothetical protein
MHQQKCYSDKSRRCVIAGVESMVPAIHYYPKGIVERNSYGPSVVIIGGGGVRRVVEATYGRDDDNSKRQLQLRGVQRSIERCVVALG